MLLPYPAQFPTKNRKIGSFTQTLAIPNSQVQSKSNQSTLRAFLSIRRLSHGAHEDPGVGMYKNCTKKEALKLAYEHKSSKAGERWKRTQSQP